MSAQSGQPTSSSEAFEHLQITATEYTEHRGNGPGCLERCLLRNSRVNVYIHGTGDGIAVYSFRVDNEFRVQQLQAGPQPTPTLRITTSRQTLADVRAAADTGRAVRQAIESGRIQVERVVTVAGVPIAIGIEEVFIGATGLAVIMFVATKYGASGLITVLGSVVKNILGGLIRLTQQVWQNLAQIATGLTVLEQLGILHHVNGIKKLRETLKERFDRRDE